MSTDLSDKTVLITGAASGLGRATSQLLADAGAKLALTDIDPSGLAQTAALVRSSASVEPVLQVGDISDPATSQRLVAAAVGAFGGLNSVCNIAGMLGEGSIEDTGVERFERIMRVNCMSQILTVQAALQTLRAEPSASIVNVASVGALVALPFMSAYCASKSAILGLTRAMAAELGPQIRCNAVCPGGIDSRMSRDLLAHFPPEDQPALLEKLVGRQIIKRFATPEEVARVVVFLVSDASAFVTGSIVPVDGGHTAW